MDISLLMGAAETTGSFEPPTVKVSFLNKDLGESIL